MLVLIGSYLAFVLRILMLSYAQNKTWQFASFDAMSCFLLFALGLKARMDLASSDAREVRLRFNATSHGADAAGGAPDLEKPKEAFSQWNSAAFSSFLPTTEPKETPQSTQYGTEPQFVPSDGVLSSRPDDRTSIIARRRSRQPLIAAEPTISDVLAFLVPLILLFLTQADDRVVTMLADTGLPGADAICGALLGLFFPVVIAAFLGIFMEGSLIDSRLLFLVSSALFGLSFLSLTEALLYLDAARPMQQKVSALLSLLESQYFHPILRDVAPCEAVHHVQSWARFIQCSDPNCCRPCIALDGCRDLRRSEDTPQKVSAGDFRSPSFSSSAAFPEPQSRSESLELRRQSSESSKMLAPSGPAPLAPELLAQLGRMEKKLEEGFRTNTELTETWPAELGQLWDVFSNAACK
eukprot:g21149.t1